jgi:two-component system nitrate/nitrite response regulator NarL
MNTDSRIRILLVESHTLLRDALQALISGWPTTEVIAASGLRDEALLLVAESRPDVVVLDLGLGEQGSDALPLLTDLRKNGHPARIIVLAGDSDTSRRVQAVLLGAAGVVRRDQDGIILRKAIEKVHAGEVWLERTLTARVLHELAGGSRAEEPDPKATRIISLSKRERELVTLASTGLSNRDIAQRLAISEATVRHHFTSIFDKLGVKNRIELVIFAYQQGLDRPAVHAVHWHHLTKS